MATTEKSRHIHARLHHEGRRLGDVQFFQVGHSSMDVDRAAPRVGLGVQFYLWNAAILEKKNCL